MSSTILSDNNFKSEIEDFQGVALVDFWAVWCGPCRTQGPILEELAEELVKNRKVKIGKLNVDESPLTSQRFQIRSIPTLMVFKNGKPTGHFIGVQQKEILRNVINDLVGKE